VQRKIFLLSTILLIIGVTVACRTDESALPTLVPTTAVTSVDDPTTPAASEPTAVAMAAATATPLPPTPTPVPPVEITVWELTEAPATAYLYAENSDVLESLHHAIYENLYTSLGYAYQPQGLVKLPSLADGDARIVRVRVNPGEPIVNASGNVVRLARGVQIVDADGEIFVYEPNVENPEPVVMAQMEVDFTFQPLVWSDGTPVTAVDSVFSYQIAADPVTPGDRFKLDRTAGYEAAGDLSVRWTGLPGFLDPEYFLNVWTPLPEHQLGGMSAGELLTAAESTRQPLSHGPYVIAEWLDEGFPILERNPYYYRQAEGFPHIDRINLFYGGDSDEIPAALSSGERHLLLNMNPAMLPDALAWEEDGAVTTYIATTQIFEHIDFGIDSWENYGDGARNGRPDWFEDARVRQAMTQCLNRQGLIDALLSGQSAVMPAYVTATHPLFPADAQTWPYDPTAGNARLDEIGLIDTDGDGIRELVEYDLSNTIVATTTMSITLGTDSESAFRLQMNELVAADLAACGIQVTTYDIPAIDWYADGPFSPLFGRRFDLASFAWRTNIRPPCSLYNSDSITGPEEQGFGGWLNVNATGWSNEAYDAACTAALEALPGTPEYTEAHQEALRIFSQELPMIPLFPYLKVSVAAPELQNLMPDPTQPSLMWNVFAWELAED
jgi:peptide/nickel transport system substrate-binding protein